MTKKIINGNKVMLPAPATSTGSTKGRKTGELDLLTVYMGKNLSHLFHDATARPEHYGELLHYVDCLRRGETVDGQTRSQLMVRYTERSAPPKKAEAQRQEKKLDEDEDEDPDSDKKDPEKKNAKKDDVPVFEDQDDGPSIKMI